MKSKAIILLIKDTQFELSNLVSTSSNYAFTKKPISDFKKVLDLLMFEIVNNPNKVNNRVLRAIHDVGTITVKEFEDTKFETSLFRLIEVISNEIPEYRNLEPLRMDFDLGEPI